ncbi:DUF5996 family protein [Asanoa sp. NPDC049518]|uniref:DUF5996 family protein n=1 Tax=unclassified Asanoa TaxID=2685164 RepID=UPI0034443F7A
MREADGWPALPVAAWQPTRDTVQLWTQIVGKTRLALAPPVNHWWNVTLYVNSTGLTTSLMPYQDRGVEIAFDFVAHVLDLRTTTGQSRQLALEPRSVADFYAEYRAHLADLDIDVMINPLPVELPDVIPFDQDHTHDSYDAAAMHAFWTSLVSADRVLSTFRAEYRAKVSPVHFFWGAFDLAVTRFSGRPAPRHPGGVPNCPDRVMWEAYCDEVSSAGYWPGGRDEGLFYSYAYPEPPGFRDRVAGYDEELGEFVLPYASVRSADDPDAVLLDFLRRTYQAATTSGTWPAG